MTDEREAFEAELNARMNMRQDCDPFYGMFKAGRDFERSQIERRRQQDKELVEAFEACVDWLDWLYHPEYDDQYRSNLRRIQRAREALAKYRAAQGEQ